MEKENKFLEFKREKTDTYLKTVSAFANYYDGEIRFGVDDKGLVVPIENQSAFALDIKNQINDNIKPNPDYSISLNNNGTVSLYIRKGFNTPYFYKNKTFKRNNTSTIEVDGFELKRLVLEGSNLHFDEIKYTSNEKLSFDYLSKILVKTIQLTKFDDDTLKNLELLTNNGYNNAAALLSDKNDFPGLDIAVFGENSNTFKERIDLSNISLLNQFDKAMEIFERNYVIEKVEGKYREKVELIPEVAFREAIANAIVHRAYDVNANTKVSMFKDKIEVSSPGGLMFGITKEEFLRGAFSVLRNPIVANVFKRVKIIEAFATGIARINESYSNNELKPTFEIDDHSIKIMLPLKNAQAVKTLQQSEFLNKLSLNIKYTRAELEKISGFNKDKTIRIINELLDDNLLEKEGEGKSTLYFKK